MKKYTVIDLKHCAACGECVRVCPRNAASVYKGLYAVINHEKCASCGLCTKECPSGAIRILSE